MKWISRRVRVEIERRDLKRRPRVCRRRVVFVRLEKMNGGDRPILCCGIYRGKDRAKMQRNIFDDVRGCRTEIVYMVCVLHLPARWSCSWVQRKAIAASSSNPIAEINHC